MFNDCNAATAGVQHHSPPGLQPLHQPARPRHPEALPPRHPRPGQRGPRLPASRRRARLRGCRGEGGTDHGLYTLHIPC